MKRRKQRTIRTPNALTLKTFNDTDKGRDLVECRDVADMLEKLGIDKKAGCTMKLTALIEREGDGFVSICPQLDIASQGISVEEARDNLREAVELFLECASREEIHERLHEEIFVTQIEVGLG